LRSKKAYTSQNLDFAQYAIAITSIDSNLDKLAKSSLAGNFSHVRLGREGALRKCLPWACYQLPYKGIDIRAMLAGAQEMAATRTPQIKKTSCFDTTSWYFAGNGRGEKTWLCCHTKTVCCCSVATYNNW